MPRLGEAVEPAHVDSVTPWWRDLGSEGAQPTEALSWPKALPFPLDWSERRDHLADQLADELYAHFTAQGWLRRTAGRAMEVTERGRRELLPRLGASDDLRGSRQPPDDTRCRAAKPPALAVYPRQLSRPMDRIGNQASSNVPRKMASMAGAHARATSRRGRRNIAEAK